MTGYFASNSSMFYMVDASGRVWLSWDPWVVIIV